MSEIQKLPIPTVETVKGAINISITKMGTSLQGLQTKSDSFSYNEDDVEEVAEFIAFMKKIKKAVEVTHKEGKAPFKEGADAWDDGKKAIIQMIDAVLIPTDTKFQAQSRKIEEKRLEQERDKLRIKAIQDGIQANLIQFSAKIGACNTTKELTSIESLINLEKSESRKSKYMEFHDDAIALYNKILLPKIKEQKEKVKQKEDLERQIKDAENANNPEKIDELSAKKEDILNEIEQNKVDVQQDVVYGEDLFQITPVEEILPDVNLRETIKFEIVDLLAAVKKCPELLEVNIKFREAQKLAMTLKDAGSFNGKSELVVNGIKFFINKQYK
jgi:hypothetical protein